MTDFISRTDAIEAVHNWYDQPYKDKKDCIRGVDKIALDIEALPSADITETEECQKCQETTERVLLNKASAEAVQGEWIIDGAYWQHCNKCGVAVNRFAVEQVKASEHENLHFCPNCGARMKGGDSE